jgi:hypothetical protein
MRVRRFKHHSNASKERTLLRIQLSRVELHRTIEAYTGRCSSASSSHPYSHTTIIGIARIIWRRSGRACCKKRGRNRVGEGQESLEDAGCVRPIEERYELRYWMSLKSCDLRNQSSYCRMNDWAETSPGTTGYLLGNHVEHFSEA